LQQADLTLHLGLAERRCGVIEMPDHFVHKEEEVWGSEYGGNGQAVGILGRRTHKSIGREV
jgi:hypothetical protein